MLLEFLKWVIKLGIDLNFGGDFLSFKVLAVLIKEFLNKLARVELSVLNLFFPFRIIFLIHMVSFSSEAFCCYLILFYLDCENIHFLSKFNK